MRYDSFVFCFLHGAGVVFNKRYDANYEQARRNWSTVEEACLCIVMLLVMNHQNASELRWGLRRSPLFHIILLIIVLLICIGKYNFMWDEDLSVRK